MLAPIFVMALVAGAESERYDVAVDWSRVPDEAITRCGLSGLESALLQALVDEHYAVVKEADVRGVRVTIDVDGSAFRVRAEHRSETVRGDVPIPTPCDSTIEVDLVDRMMRAVREVIARARAAETPPVLAAGPTLDDSATADGGGWWLSAGPMLVSPGSTSWLFGVRVSIRRLLPFGLAAGLVGEAAMRAPSGLVLAEPVLAVIVTKMISAGGALELGVGGEAALLAHLYQRDDGGGGHLDARFGLPLEVKTPILGAGLALVPYFRVREVQHRIGDDIVHDGRAFGVLLTLFVSPIDARKL
jgi:hypothetical protein